MEEQLRRPFEKFVDWRQCAAIMHRHNSKTAAHCRQSTNFSNRPRIFWDHV